MAKKRWLTAGIYVLMGWMCLIAIKPLLESLSSIGLFWLVLGGLFYTFGALVYATKSFDFYPGKFGFHEVWHLFVSAGAAAHFALVYGFIES